MADATTIVLTCMVSAFFYHWFTAVGVADLTKYFALGLIASLVYIFRFGGSGSYDFEQASRPGVEIADILISWITTALLLLFLAFLIKISLSFSRGSFILFGLAAPVGLLGMRKLQKNLLTSAVAHGAIGRRNVVLVGTRSEISSLHNRDLLAVFGAGDVTRFTLTEAIEPLRQPVDVATFNEVANFVRKNDASDILLAVSWHDTARIDFIRDQVKTLPVWVRLLPDVQVRELTNYASSAGQQLLSIEIQRAPMRATELIVKRAFDLTFGAIALLCFSPVIGLAALAIKLGDAGPIIFRQHRKGFNGHEFLMFKLRTMRALESSQSGEAVVQASRNDPRVTKVGRFLRASSIDELPQLLNVLRGEMSLIGPRPHALAHDNHFEKVLEDYAFRHHVKPGMTGWAQVNGLRGPTPTIDLISRRVKMDLWYIDNWSLWLDVIIVIKTVFAVLRRSNAY